MRRQSTSKAGSIQQSKNMAASHADQFSSWHYLFRTLMFPKDHSDKFRTWGTFSLPFKHKHTYECVGIATFFSVATASSALQKLVTVFHCV